MIGLAELAWVFAKLGALGFGGPFALLALMETEVVKKRGWVTPEEFAHSTAIGTLTPGPIFFTAATNIGYQLRGLAGAFVAAVACLAPSFFLAVGFAYFYLKVESLPVVVGATRGLSAAVVGLLVIVAIRMGRSLIKTGTGLLVAGAAFAGLTLLAANPVLIFLLAGFAGLIFFRSGEPRNKVKGGSAG